MLTVDSFTYRWINSSFQQFHQKTARVINYYTDLELAGKLKSVGFEVKESKYFISSPIYAFFFTQAKWLGWGLPFLALFPIAYPLSILSERFLSRKAEGYLLVMKARKGEQP